ncbi:hypothetical protein BD410DRAFT_810037 [Rickenella mellea]|uniref:Uncharacterized protein n=1 Tax=Rickenella mellea TaxID=50990 RepID=A0A4Y7PG91_9AGAM|nr:hypothetical protein BD410DRAFT_810037 [Rickenella mellea]
MDMRDPGYWEQSGSAYGGGGTNIPQPTFTASVQHGTSNETIETTRNYTYGLPYTLPAAFFPPSSCNLGRHFFRKVAVLRTIWFDSDTVRERNWKERDVSESLLKRKKLGDVKDCDGVETLIVSVCIRSLAKLLALVLKLERRVIPIFEKLPPFDYPPTFLTEFQVPGGKLKFNQIQVKVKYDCIGAPGARTRADVVLAETISAGYRVAPGGLHLEGGLAQHGKLGFSRGSEKAVIRNVKVTGEVASAATITGGVRKCFRPNDTAYWSLQEAPIFGEGISGHDAMSFTVHGKPHKMSFACEVVFKSFSSGKEERYKANTFGFWKKHTYEQY